MSKDADGRERYDPELLAWDEGSKNSYRWSTVYVGPHYVARLTFDWLGEESWVLTLSQAEDMYATIRAHRHWYRTEQAWTDMLRVYETGIAALRVATYGVCTSTVVAPPLVVATPPPLREETVEDLDHAPPKAASFVDAAVDEQRWTREVWEITPKPQATGHAHGPYTNWDKKPKPE